MARKLILLFCLVCFFQLTARAGYDFNQRCIDAYNAILSLKIPEARLIIQKERQRDPQNGILILLDNYADYFGLLASDNKAEYDKLKDRKSDRVSALEDIKGNSPYYLFSQAEIYLQWGLLKGRYGDYFSSGNDLKSARSLLTENAKKYPDFLPNQKSLALINVVFGSLPSNLKKMSDVFGMKGNADAGIKQLESLRVQLPKTQYSFYNNEVIFFLCQDNIDVLHNYGSYATLISYLQGMPDGSLLKTYLQGYVSAKTGHNDEAIGYLEKAPSPAQYVTLPGVSYIMGNAKLNRMDSDAYVYLQRYLKEYAGKNYIKDTYLKLGYFYLLQNNTERYNYYLNMARTKGFIIDEKDKQALREANDAKPDIDLLKARFYFDGGYYDKALALLKNKQAGELNLLRDKIERNYRLGRVYDKTGQFNEAVASYTQAMNLGRVTSYYYAANAALSVGKLYEQRKDFEKAAYYYHQALDMKNHEYQSSIDNDAKEGLRRIGQ